MGQSISVFNYPKTFTSDKIIKISSFLKDPNLDLKRELYYINLDLEYYDLLINSKVLVNNLFYKLYFYNKNYFVFTKLSLSILKKSQPLSGFLHKSLKMIDNYLFLEQLLNLLELTSTVLEYPKNINYLEDKEIHKIVKKIPLENLNEAQMKSVKSIKGPNLLLAPAGSGKTKTLVNRIIYLLNEGVNPDNILVLAFNKKAEIEISNRILNDFNKTTNIKTLHAFGNQIIKEYTNLEFNGLNSFSNIKNNLINEKDMEDTDKRNFFKHLKEDTYGFDDMIYLAIRILLDNKKTRKKIQNKYQYILIDEFQDLNKAQLLLIDIISRPLNNLFVVGDDDQMIYRFRGADEEAILNYEHNYGTITKNILNINYRSPKNIIYHANQVISYNQNRFKKEITAFQNNDGDLDLIIESDMEKEAIEVVNYIKRTSFNGAILYRYNSYGDYLKIVLQKYGIKVANAKLDLLKTDLGQNILNHLKLIIENNPSSQVIKACLYNFDNEIPYSFINSITSLNDLFKKEKLDKLDIKYQISCETFIKRVKKMKLNNPNLITLINSFKLDDYQDDEDNLKIIYEIGDVLENINEVYHYLIKNQLDNKEGIVLSTIHKTKGNEYNNVIYFHVVNNGNTIIEDERRLFYVAVTRTKKNLLITTVDNEKSIFIKEYFLNKKLINYPNMDLKLDLMRLENINSKVYQEKIELIKKELYYRSLLI